MVTAESSWTGVGHVQTTARTAILNGAGSLLTTVVVGMPLSLAVPLALFAGFVSEFIPAVGTSIGAAIPILISLAIKGLVAGLAVLAYALIYQQVENYLLSPRISAGTMSLNGGWRSGMDALAGGAVAGPIAPSWRCRSRH